MQKTERQRHAKGDREIEISRVGERDGDRMRKGERKRQRQTQTQRV